MAKPWKIPYFEPHERLGICLERILRTRYREMLSYENAVLSGTDIDALHDMRVSSRRLQAVMKIFREFFPRKRFRIQYATIRSILRSLGEVRDHDVLILKLETHRASASLADHRGINLLIARERTAQTLKRKALRRHLLALQKGKHEQEFFRFLSDIT